MKEFKKILLAKLLRLEKSNMKDSKLEVAQKSYQGVILLL
jgi:hypothetical protein